MQTLVPLVFAAIGAAITFEASRLGIFSYGEIGTGFFPLCCGIGLVAASLLQVVRRDDGAASLEQGASPFGLASVMVVGSIIWFALTIETLGLSLAAVGSVALASLGVRRPLLETVSLSIGLSVAAVVVFYVLLGAPVRP